MHEAKTRLSELVKAVEEDDVSHPMPFLHILTVGTVNVGAALRCGARSSQYHPEGPAQPVPACPQCLGGINTHPQPDPRRRGRPCLLAPMDTPARVGSSGPGFL